MTNNIECPKCKAITNAEWSNCENCKINIGKYNSEYLEVYTRTRMMINENRNKYINPKGSYERKFLRGKTK